jgi:hypothetical protein
MLRETCVAKVIGPTAAFLLVIVASVEDALRYRRAPNFWDAQLQELLGVGSYGSLQRARQAAVAERLLFYRAGAKGRAGEYWTLMPESDGTDDDLSSECTSKVEENAEAKTTFLLQNGGANGGANEEYTERNGGANGVPPVPSPNKPDPPKKKTRQAGIESRDVTIPPTLDCQDVRKALADWLDHKRSRGQSYETPSAVERLFSKFRTPSEFVAAVDHSIGCNYVGLFAPNPSGSQRAIVGPGTRYNPSSKEAMNGTF